MFNPKRIWLYYCYHRNKYLEKHKEEVATFPSIYGMYDLKPKHKRALRAIFWRAVRKEWNEDIDNYKELLRHFDYID